MNEYLNFCFNKDYKSNIKVKLFGVIIFLIEFLELICWIK